MKTWRYGEVSKDELVEFYYAEIDGYIFMIGKRRSPTGSGHQIAWGHFRAVPNDAVMVQWYKLPVAVKQKIVEIEEQFGIGIHNPDRSTIMRTK